MSTYNELSTLSELRECDAFRRLTRIVGRLKQGGLEKKSFYQAEDAIQALQKIKGFTCQGSVDVLGEFGTVSKDVRDWNISTAVFFFVKDKNQAADDNRQWVHLVCARVDLRHKFGAVSMRRFPVRMQFAHVRRRLLENSGAVLDINSDPIIFMALSGTLLAHLLPLVKDAPQKDGVFPLFIPNPQGLYLGFAQPCSADDFGYTYGECVRWVRGKPPVITPTSLPGLPTKGPLPGLGGALPSIPAKPVGKDTLRPFIQHLAAQAQQAVPDECISFTIKPTYFPVTEVSINTHVDSRDLKGAQRGLYNHHLVQLLGDKEFAASMNILSTVYMLGNLPVAQDDLKHLARLRYADDALRGIISGPQWGGASIHSLRTYAKDNPKDPTPT